jgi:hypothetical protein
MQQHHFFHKAQTQIFYQNTFLPYAVAKITILIRNYCSVSVKKRREVTLSAPLLFHRTNRPLVCVFHLYFLHWPVSAILVFFMTPNEVAGSGAYCTAHNATSHTVTNDRAAYGACGTAHYSPLGAFSHAALNLNLLFLRLRLINYTESK